MELGAAAQIAPDRDPGLCLFAEPPEHDRFPAAPPIVTPLVSPHRQAEPRDPDSALSLALGAQSPMAESPPTLLSGKSGMTHVGGLPGRPSPGKIYLPPLRPLAYLVAGQAGIPWSQLWTIVHSWRPGILMPCPVAPRHRFSRFLPASGESGPYPSI